MTRRAGKPIKNVVIVGGGTAGWMTAAALSRLTKAGVSITLVESEEIGTVGVGEATIPPLLDYNLALGIDQIEFIRATQATFKLGIEFVNWARQGDRYLHPFGVYGRDAHGVKFHEIWLRDRQTEGTEIGPDEIGDYCLSVVAARNDRFTWPTSNPGAVLSTLRYAFHFDAGLYARFLRRYAEDRGVARVEGRIERVEQDPESGYITAVRLNDGRVVEGEFFVDCSGFRSLLLGDTLGVAYQSWQHWLPCDRAIAIPCAGTLNPTPYTRATAGSAGWRWRIPLQHRIGNGHVFSSAHIDESRALDELLQGLDGAAIAEPRTLRFVAGRRERMWEKNCVAIGLSSGFIEPLESTSIHLIQSGVFKLMGLFPDSGFDQAEIDQYNRFLVEEYERIRDFIILHYWATERDDSDFWNHCRNMEIPDTLAQKIELWMGKARLFRASSDLFTEDSWIAVLLGQRKLPESYDPLVGAFSVEESRRFLASIRDVIGKTALAMPTHQQFIDRHCRADPVELPVVGAVA
ncbi:MAG TPA: tryptophan halogenase family protein [Sphingomicrobium sp.]|nr:tryptophan halogenase family protein [Sphingomicrobium sp.]